MMPNKKGFSLMEIIVAAMILALVMAGMVNIFISGKRYVLHNRARMTGGEIGKLFIDPLQASYVRQAPTNTTSNDGWEAGSNLNNPLASHNATLPANPNLCCGGNCSNTTTVPEWNCTNCNNTTVRTLNTITYRAAYKIGKAPNPSTLPTNSQDLRKVTADIIWKEPSS